jgi:hypothetical protein
LNSVLGWSIPDLTASQDRVTIIFDYWAADVQQVKTWFRFAFHRDFTAKPVPVRGE